MWVELPEMTETELALCNASDMHLRGARFDSWLETSYLTEVFVDFLGPFRPVLG